MLRVRDSTTRQGGSPSLTVAAGSGPTVPLVADRHNLHTDEGVPPVSRRQAVAAKAELASFREYYLPAPQAEELKLLTLHRSDRNHGLYLAVSDQIIRLQAARRQSRNQEWSGSVLSRSDQLIV